MIGWIGALWGLAGVSALLIYTIGRLAPMMWESLEYTWAWNHWASLIINALLMAYYEGYKGFQKGFSPRVAARARHLITHPQWLHVILAPFYCAGYFHTTTRRQISVIALTVFIICLVLLVGMLQQPWRGIVDASVILGLTWGLISLWIYGAIALTANEFSHAPDLPQGAN